MTKLRSFDFIGKIYKTKKSGDCFVVDFKNSENITVMFYDGYLSRVNHYNLKSGNIRNPFYHKNLFCGVGVTDISGSTDGVVDKEYRTWRNMISRCYNENLRRVNKAYEDCSVSDSWLLYSNFKKDVGNMVGVDCEDYHLDKDILVKGNRVYSKETCVFVPREINNALTKSNCARGKYPIGVKKSSDSGYIARVSVFGEDKYLGSFKTPEQAFLEYKTAKESYLKDLAEKWGGVVDHRVYKALVDYKVEITD